MYSIQPELTREYVFSKVSQEQCFNKYLAVPVQTKKLFRSPLRQDDKPTCGFTYKNNTLIFTDFAGYFSGDCVKLVMKLFSLNYYQALDKILNDLESSPKVIFDRTKEEKEKTLIQVQKRVFNKYDASYWSQFGISSTTLKYFDVYAVQHIWIDGKLNYSYSKSDQAYAYYFGDNDYKIYFPKRKDFRFISNTQSIQGYSQLKDGDLLIITKSLKDVMALHEFDISAIALQNEIVIPKQELIDELKTRFKNIYLFYDFDLTGIRTSNKIRKLYNIPQIFLTNGRFNSIDFKAKDFSDYVKLVGKESTEKLIDYLIIEYGRI